MCKRNTTSFPVASPRVMKQQGDKIKHNGGHYSLSFFFMSHWAWKHKGGYAGRTSQNRKLRFAVRLEEASPGDEDRNRKQPRQQWMSTSTEAQWRRKQTLPPSETLCVCVCVGGVSVCVCVSGCVGVCHKKTKIRMPIGNLRSD